MSQGLSIDLTDPAVQRMLGGSHPLATRKPAVVQLAGDAPDPTGASRAMGASSTTYLNRGKHEVIAFYQGPASGHLPLFMTVDVYQTPGQPLLVHLLCPRCHKHATIRAEQKTIVFDPLCPNPMRAKIAESGDEVLVAQAAFGHLSIETFECPWEIGGDRHVAGALHTGSTLCRMRLVIEGNRCREAS